MPVNEEMAFDAWSVTKTSRELNKTDLRKIIYKQCLISF